ncbi:hypothetical protein BCR32DRAFT_286896 [Anaeromyces robustus]|uniref:Uncharacterized protein n=1 Tax=Anaeromyces robustus TaxID=1754192 RepID=A0A1Y1VTU9_9FUNG|nr:hypothetical protein BCR32DRAFT_286896 [Anaeromyces robustus]|eukprot:ORX64729.1 hypothetical protein BCR32DRAFT_286896 [Anaeromyces robustus]
MFLSKFFGTENFNLQQVVTPCFGFIVAIYNYYFNFNTNELRIFLPYYTHQTFIIGIILQIKDLNKTLPKRFQNESLNVFIHILFNGIIPTAFLVTIIFWFVIFPSLDFSKCNILNYFQHITEHLLQSIFVGIDWYLILIPTSVKHFIPMFLAGINFLIFAQFYHAYSGNWIYDFVDTSNENSFLTYTAVITFWGIFGIIFTIIHKKKNNCIIEKFSKNETKNNKKSN